MRTNYPAVVVCAIVYWLLGGLWYAVIFGNEWGKLEHLTDAQLTANPWLHYIITFFLNLLIAFVLAQICIWRNANTASRGAAIGVLLWFGFLGPTTLTTYLYEFRPMQLFAINEFYPLVALRDGSDFGGLEKEKTRRRERRLVRSAIPEINAVQSKAETA